MPQPILYVAVTNHGFGHTARTAAVVATIQELCPEIVVIMVTSAPRWLLESYLHRQFIYRPRAFDIGVVQSDSITMDKAATLKKLQHIKSRQAATIASEVSFIKQNRVGLIFADIPPLVAAIAQAAGVPCWMASNFGWDLIYRPWGGEFEAIADWISDCFSTCDRLFRLPFNEPMSAFPVIEDIGLTGGRPQYPADELRQKLNLTAPPEKTVLLTFGGLGLAQIPYEGLQRFSDWQFLTFDQAAPELPNLVKISGHHYRPVDLMPLCSRVVSKPGYGTFAEACQLGIPIISIEREGFAEAPLLINGLREYAHHLVINGDQFYDGSWAFLEQDLTPPRSSTPLPTNGNEAIARSVVDYFQSIGAL
ncbi:MAG: hypothetical protein WBA57_14975 [Elainellaceae cyanobacterium]